MKAGTQVWAAREGADGVEVGEARVVRVLHGLLAVVEPPLFGGTEWRLRALHATRTAALLTLEQDLREMADEDRKLADQFNARAAQRLTQAEQAKRMAGER